MVYGTIATEILTRSGNKCQSRKGFFHHQLGKNPPETEIIKCFLSLCHQNDVNKSFRKIFGVN